MGLEEGWTTLTATVLICYGAVTGCSGGSYYDTVRDGLTSKGIMTIYTDRRGDLWLGADGVNKFNGESFDRIH